MLRRADPSARIAISTVLDAVGKLSSRCRSYTIHRPSDENAGLDSPEPGSSMRRGSPPLAGMMNRSDSCS